MRRRLAGLVAAGVLSSGLTACEAPWADPLEAYCDKVDEAAPTLTQVVDERGIEGLLDEIDTLWDLADEAPDDIREDWKVLLGALEEFEDALDDAGIDPAQVTELPKDLPAADRAAIEKAATRMLSTEVSTATGRVEQHALDVCHRPLI